MTQRFFILAAVLMAARFSAQADAGALVNFSVLENNVEYLRVGVVETNLAAEIESAQSTLAATNKIAGTVLDLRFAEGGDLESAKAAADLLSKEKLPLAILVNDETRDAAAGLAADLRKARAGLIFGDSDKVKPDIAIAVKMEDESNFMENPFGTLAQSETNSIASTNDSVPFVDHTSEADLVRAKIKDGDEDENTAQPPDAELQKPFIRDPVLARAVDLIEGLAVVRQSRL
jgi:hypothetical protein